MKRKTLTLSRDFFEKVNNLTEQTKHEVVDAVFDLFFNEKQIKYENYNDVTRTALACIVPDLRRIQTQFENGMVEKKSKTISQGFFCPSEASQVQLNLASLSQPGSSILNNKYNNNIYNINNNQSQSITASSENYTRLLEKINTLRQNSDSSHESIIERTEDLIQRVANEKESPIINGQPVPVADVFKRYLQVFENRPAETILKHLNKIFSTLDTTCESKKITNSYKYLISLFYNSALEQIPTSETTTQKSSSKQFMTHNYLSEEVNNVFNDIDSELE